MELLWGFNKLPDLEYVQQRLCHGNIALSQSHRKHSSWMNKAIVSASLGFGHNFSDSNLWIVSGWSLPCDLEVWLLYFLPGWVSHINSTLHYGLWLPWSLNLVCLYYSPYSLVRSKNIFISYTHISNLRGKKKECLILLLWDTEKTGNRLSTVALINWLWQ